MINDPGMNAFDGAVGCGAQLREARIAAGLSIEQVGAQLHMPVQVIRTLEDEQWDRLGAPVFVRGQLRSYARLLKVDLGPSLEHSRIARVEPSRLISHAHTPPMRRMVDNLGRRAMYVVITAVLAVPAWYASRDHFSGAAPSTASLDVLPVPVAAEVAASAAPLENEAEAAPAARPVSPAAPYIASIAPVPRTPPVVEAAKALVISFSGDSWVEISAPDGSSLERTLIRSGEKRSYKPGEVQRVVLGNASAVEVQQAGSTVDLTPYRRANVARFTVSSDGYVVPVSN